MTEADRAKCTRIMMSIDAVGGPSMAEGELLEEARAAKMIRFDGGKIWTIKANILRRDLEDGKVAPIVDANIGGHTIRGRVEGKFTPRILRLRHWTGDSWQTLGVHRDDCTEVDPKEL